MRRAAISAPASEPIATVEPRIPNSPAPLPKLRVPPEDREELVRTCYFKRQGYVKRVIFMGTPHHGSKLSPSLMGRLAARVAGVPAQLLKATHDL